MVVRFREYDGEGTVGGGVVVAAAEAGAKEIVGCSH